MPIRILLVDDHAVVRQGLKMFLSLDSDLQVVGEAENGEDAIRLTRALHPDVVLMDLLMPVMDGSTATALIRREFPETEVIALTSVLEDEAIMKAMRAGATGYLLKDTQAEELRRAITRPLPPVRCNSRPRSPPVCSAKCVFPKAPKN
ncbi:MAG: response regulator transcription factor [Roseiflexaceae bacterium]|nr:response regulator transcription factor [Roseiflexaceae bacterium]